MSITVTLKTTEKSEQLNALAPIEGTRQIGKELDSGNVQFLRTEKDADGMVEALAQYKIDFDGSFALDYVGIDSRALLRRNTAEESIYKHGINLTEPTKLLSGALLDGYGIAQPEELEQRESLLEATQRLLDTYSFDYSRSGKRFTLTSDTDVTSVLAGAKAPEFRWSTQSTLWECLVALGAVVDALPKLIADSDGDYTVVTFYFINLYDNELAQTDDALTDAIGETVEENEYNRAMGSVVENVREQ